MHTIFFSRNPKRFFGQNFSFVRPSFAAVKLLSQRLLVIVLCYVTFCLGYWSTCAALFSLIQVLLLDTEKNEVWLWLVNGDEDPEKNLAYFLLDTTTDSAFCPSFKLAFVPILEPGQGFRDKKPRCFCPEWQNKDKRCLTLKNFLHTTGFDPKTSCLAHGFLTNSPK